MQSNYASINSNTISSIVVVKNESDKIEYCLDHLRWTNEIIIVDNGSTDNTVELCKKYTKKIYSHDKPELIPFLQNLGIQKATKDWVIIIDADVIVAEDAKNEILQKINNEDFDGYYLKHIIYFLGKPLSSPYFGEHNILKLFRRGKGYFKGEYAHESLTFSGNKIGNIKNPLFHFAHPKISDFIKKMNKYTSEDALRNYKTKKYNFFQIFIVPVLAPLFYFFFRKGHLDGMRGFLYCCLLGLYMFCERVKITERKLTEKDKRNI